MEESKGGKRERVRERKGGEREVEKEMEESKGKEVWEHRD